MTITQQQVADLREGDVVEVTDERWPEGSVLRGPLAEIPNGHSRGALTACGVVVRWSDGAPAMPVQDLTVVSRAPRPLYVNHPRTEPVASDVMRREGDDPWRMFGYSGDRWVLVGGTHEYETTDLQGAPFRLLVDGTTGQVVP